MRMRFVNDINERWKDPKCKIEHEAEHELSSMSFEYGTVDAAITRLNERLNERRFDCEHGTGCDEFTMG